jgi:hypothetical protein
MNKYFCFVLVLTYFGLGKQSLADYQGCEDPKYREYVKMRLAYFNTNSQRLLSATLSEYQDSLENSSNPFRAISDLSRHLKYSAQFDPIDVVQAKIERLFEHGDKLRLDQQVAVSVFDNFSDENHAIGIARAWVAYRQGDTQTAFSEMLNSIENANSAVLSSFGPDLHFVRHIYQDGHAKPVLTYLEKSKLFWKGKSANDMRYIWRNMIEANCEVSFESHDAVKAIELGLRVRDIRS